MKFQAPVASFIKPLQQLSAVAGGASNADDIAHNLLISVKDNNLFLRATDYRVELSFTTQVSMQSEGQTTVNAQKLREACARLDQSAIAMFSYDEMEEVLVNNWNNVVTNEDHVYHLGDFCWGKTDEWIRILKRLNGNIHIIKGNHDLKEY